MIRCDKINRAVLDQFPQAGVFIFGTQGRSTFRFGSKETQIRFVKEQIMGTRFAGDKRFAMFTHLADDLNAFGRADVHDMQRTSGFHRDRNCPSNGFGLGANRPGCQKIGPTSPAAGGGFGRQMRGDFLAFGVYGHGKVKVSGDLHSAAQGGIVGVGKIGDPAVAHECFESNDAALGEFLKMIEIVGRQAAPEGEIGQA